MIQHSEQLTSIKVLINSTLDSALVHSRHGLALKWPAILTRLEHAARIHCLLQRVVFPAEEVVSMRAVSLVVIVAEEKGIRPILGPHLVKLRRVPERLIRDLRHADGMRLGARPSRCKGFLGCVVHVILVVGRVDVLAVPASVIDVSGADVQGA